MRTVSILKTAITAPSVFPAIPVILSLYDATACIILAHFAAFIYIEPLLIKVHVVPTASISGLLLTSGISGLVRNMIAGKLIDRHVKG